ncbi:hypothetical protein IW140_002843 [Coemansia sp. RSA 1813]|nr:hypothetical protein EV178_002763 [Coemansia sp. RSA 1646]KAJ1770121.1 hypothetical protein LPJ74_003482 [Coemansia sp. RSA 1843]KAJ2089840.1 hypothetical protein IW138_003134 [Coemansia sp. RSA 986]KAJ2569762.1 hypothetical protein IW140_002843 [Coemansia sp. RSA 1813]
MLEKRQSGFADDSGDALDTALDTSLDTLDAAFDDGSDAGAVDIWMDPANRAAETVPLDGGADNLVGNSFAQIDDSTNIDNSSVEYPGDTQMTDNTGTAVSGNNNDIMPIINAPVTVIINSDDNNDSKNLRRPPSLGSGASPPVSAARPGGASRPVSQQSAALSALSSLSPGQLSQLLMATQGLQQQSSLYPKVGDTTNNAPDSFVPPIQRLVEYALAVSQSRL